MTKIKDITGQKFGKLTPIERISEVADKNKGHTWRCQCECGNFREVKTSYLTGGYVKMCNECAHIEKVKRGKLAEGRPRKSPLNERLHGIWSGMKSRCYNPKVAHYDRYGGRGITVCESWRKRYSEFRKWALKNGYDDSLTIERIDINGNYCPENCKWITHKEQGYNKENTLYIEFEGKKIPLKKFTDEMFLDYPSIHYYLKSFKPQTNSV